MAIPEITPRVIFGLKTDIKGNVAYITDNELLYPVGAILAVHNFEERHQRFIKLDDRRKSVNIICVSNNKQVLAVTERGEKPLVSLYEVQTLAFRKTLSLPAEVQAAEFASLSFSHDSNYLAAVTGEPDWTMLFYNIAKGRVESSVRANNPSNPGPVTQVACNPKDNLLVCVVGPGLFRLFGFSDAGWRPFGFQKSDALQLTCACWLSSDRVVAGTKDGSLIFFDSGEVKAVVRGAAEVLSIVIKLKEEPVATSSLSLQLSTTSSPDASLEVCELLPLTKGFAFACGPGTVHLFEREGLQKYRKHGVLRVPQPHFADGPELTAVRCLAASVTQDQVAATTLCTQLYAAPLWSAPGHDSEQVTSSLFREVGERLHHGAVGGLSTCAWKPVFMTCGRVDRTVRLWNYETGAQELEHQYQDDVHCVSLHPTGLFAAIGFSDKLRFVILLIDDIQPMSEFPVRSCRECVFSGSGHLLAAVNGNIIHIYSSVSFESIHTLATHKGIVRGLAWTAGDQRLVSCGMEGAVYEWEVASGGRVGEAIVKNCSFYTVAAIPGSRTVLAAGSDGRIYEIGDSAVVRTLDVTGEELNCIALSRSDSMLFLGTASGTVLSVKFPLTDPVAYNEHNIHSGAVTRMLLTHSDHTLVSCSEDGSICLWDVEPGRVRPDAAARHMSAEVLIGRSDLEAKLRAIEVLTSRIEEMKEEQAYQQRLDEKDHADKMAALRASCTEAIEELKEKITRLEAAHADQTSEINSGIARMQAEHRQALVTMETDYSRKLIVEYDKFKALEEKMAEMRQKQDRRLQEARDDKQLALQKLQAESSAQMQQCDIQIAKLEEEAHHLAMEHEVMRQLIEEDADQEIAQLRADYETQLREERATSARLHTEAGLLRRKSAVMQKEAEEARHEAERLGTDLQRLRQTTAELERDVLDLKKEIGERDATIQAKETKLYELQHKNQELEKYKFVLNYKIDELKKQIEPKEKEIQDKKEQIKEMAGELERLEAASGGLELRLARARDQARGCSLELQAQRERSREAEMLLHRIRADLHACSGAVQDPRRLKDLVLGLYRKYGQEDTSEARLGQDAAVQLEMMRQREHLEATIASLRAQLKKGQQDHRLKVMEENITLLGEVNSLRQQLSTLQQQARRGGASELHLALAGQHRTVSELQAQIQEQENTIELLRTEIRRLAGRLDEEVRAASN